MLTDVQKIIDECVAGMQEEFKRHYTIFSSLRYENKEWNLDMSQLEYPDIAFSSTNKLVSRTNDRVGGRIMGGGAAGTIAGTIIAGSIFGGPLVGGVIGGLYGLYRGFKSSNNLERDEYFKVKAAMENEINAYFISFHDKVAAEILSKKKEIDGSIEQYANNHTSEYGVAVEGLIKQQEDKIQTTECDIKGLTDQVRNLEDIENEIQMRLLLLNNQK